MMSREQNPAYFEQEPDDDSMLDQLGAALSVIAAALAFESVMHADVSAWSAPSECHASVSRGEERRMEEASKQAHRIAGAPVARIFAEAERRIGKAALQRAMDRAEAQCFERMSPHARGQL